MDRLSNSSLPVSGPGQIGTDRSVMERLKADELAREFESMLLLQMLRQMRASVASETDEDKGLYADNMLDMVDGELARQLSKSGGFGLADIMRKAVERQLPSAGQVDNTSTVAGIQASLPGGPTPAAVNPVADTDAAAGIDRGRMTSNFGWRSDPFTGATRYHQGIDLKAAYGQEVPAAGDGRVVDVADRGAYGLSVVVEHPNGLKTRYAHLSTAAVSVGDRVLQGQELGRVGQSGRSTGPHLHFEVMRNGQRIDPTSVVALQGSGLGGLKLAGAAADFHVGGRTHTPAISGVDDED